MPWSCPRCGRSFRNRRQFHACDLRGPGARMWQPPRGTPSARPPRRPAGMAVAGWTCPRCRRTFKNASQAHSCVRLTVDDFYRGKPAARRLHRAVAAFVRRHGGPFRQHAQKTRIAFIATMSFAGVHGAGKDWVDFGFLLRRRIQEPRLKRFLEAPGDWYGYRLRVTAPGQLEGWLAPLVAEAYDVGTGGLGKSGRPPTSK